MTLQQWLKEGEAQLLAGPHPERARRDAEALLLHAMKCSRATLLARGKESPKHSETDHYLQLIERRKTGEPVQQIVGECEFYGMPFRITRDVLIPRPETEHLVEKAIELAMTFSALRIADVGTGSGAIAVALAANLPRAELSAIDLSTSAIAVASENAERNGLADRIRFLRGDLLAPVAQEQFEMIVSNPPYVPAGDRASLAVEVRDYEPALALFAGTDGLDIYRRLIPDALRTLVPGGYLALEIGYGQAEAVAALLADSGFAEIEFTADLQAIPRVVCARRVAPKE